MSYDIAQPYVAVFLVFRKEDKIAFLLRTNTDWMKNHYGIVSGKVEKTESLTSAAIREAKEEVGIKLSPKSLNQVLVVYRHEPSKQAADWIDVYFEVNNWQGELYNAEPDVHGELKWFELEKLPKNVVPSHKYGLKQIVKGKSLGEYGWDKE